MLLSIDRVLQLLSEGKSIEKIAELAEGEIDDVIGIIDEARKLINKHEKLFLKTCQFIDHIVDFSLITIPFVKSRY